MQSRRKEKAMARTPVIVIVACLAACSTSEPSDGTFAGADFSDASVRTAERFAKLPDSFFDRQGRIIDLMGYLKLAVAGRCSDSQGDRVCKDAFRPECQQRQRFCVGFSVTGDGGDNRTLSSRIPIDHTNHDLPRHRVGRSIHIDK